MKNRSKNGMDAELAKKIEGMTPNQKKLLADIYAGLAERLRRKSVSDSLMNWKNRNGYTRN